MSHLPLPVFALTLMLVLSFGNAHADDNRYKVREYANTPERVQSCRDYNPQRNAYFGDLHVHTSFSSDAYTQDVRRNPYDAYQYAFGNGKGRDKSIRTLERPLDFMAVTDHAEFLGETQMCASGVAADTKFCAQLNSDSPHNFYMLKFIMSPIGFRDNEICGRDNAACHRSLATTWERTIEIAQHWNDNSDSCSRTTFVGFEYSSHRLGSNLHRNVIFRNASVTRNPISYIDVQREWELWEILDNQCIEGHPDCDVLAIPHNSNISNGRMFAVDYPNTWLASQQRERAALRAKIEPLVEIMQHKGDSECRNGLEGVAGGEDEWCAFEKTADLRAERIFGDKSLEPCYTGPLADWLPHRGPDCMSDLNFVRYALIQGLDEQRRLGVNPYKFGILAATDTHNATGGAVAEDNFQGHLGILDGDVQKRLRRLDGAASVGDNPGGLMGVWSEQNTRADLWQAMKRKEVFGTSGPRIQLRFFGGWDYAQQLCGGSDWLADAYAQGTPMGGDLPAKSGVAKAPVFVVHALPDVGGGTVTPLAHLQIIKGWMDDEGQKQQRVYTVSSQGNIAPLDLQSCQRPRARNRASAMCQVWSDPEFDAERSSVYYARVIEAPTCRYTHHQCLSVEGSEDIAICASDDTTVPKTIEERAWSSPIWYTPQ